MPPFLKSSILISLLHLTSSPSFHPHCRIPKTLLFLPFWVFLLLLLLLCLYSRCVSYVRGWRIQLRPVLLRGCCYPDIIFLSTRKPAGIRRLHVLHLTRLQRSVLHKSLFCAPCELLLFTCTHKCMRVWGRHGVCSTHLVQRPHTTKSWPWGGKCEALQSFRCAPGWTDIGGGGGGGVGVASGPEQLKPPIIIKHNTKPDAV